ncbi:MAG: ABC transporter ATP-binding protein [Chloracidobacterium sp.]|uniref:ABC transporter ATP-binding protein n=1 Tax=Chloracidobacterium validum TaxID=2821543 RepID=A0ABX8BBG6_9BACT|nr:ABC transporter ATP-binding protein [Chloracidobacterium validum]QUW04282.1 ABC transporter ATP-binding protein [Chloracidobacterium validum]
MQAPSEPSPQPVPPQVVPEQVTPDIAVECRAVTKAFGQGESKTLALRGVDFQARLGEMTFLVGESGSGKTTLISIIAGLLDATEGEIHVLGQNMAALSNTNQVRFRRKNLGFVFQQFNLLPALTAAENVAVPLLAAGMARPAAVARATELLGSVGLAHRAAHVPSQLSGGQQQRVALARAVIHEPRLIVCDEPTSALDGATGRTVMELLAAVAVRPDRAVIVVTHDSRIFSFAQAIAHMADGNVTHTERRTP